MKVVNKYFFENIKLQLKIVKFIILLFCLSTFSSCKVLVKDFVRSNNNEVNFKLVPNSFALTFGKEDIIEKKFKETINNELTNFCCYDYGMMIDSSTWVSNYKVNLYRSENEKNQLELAKKEKIERNKFFYQDKFYKIKKGMEFSDLDSLLNIKIENRDYKLVAYNNTYITNNNVSKNKLIEYYSLDNYLLFKYVNGVLDEWGILSELSDSYIYNKENIIDRNNPRIKEDANWRKVILFTSIPAIIYCTYNLIKLMQ